MNQRVSKIAKKFPEFRNVITTHTALCKMYEVCSENNGNFRFLKKNIYLFVYIDVVAFKIFPIRYYALVPALLPILETLLELDLWDSL